MIIAFTKDWDDVPTCTTHILREMAKTRPVLWIESIGTRRPSFKSGGKDLRRLVRRLIRLWRGPERKENRLWVLAPLLIPKPAAPWQCRLNRILFRFQERAALRTIRRSAGSVPRAPVSPSEYWSFVPNAADLLPVKARATVVYYCADNWALFPDLDGAYLGIKERELAARADVIFASARGLVDKMRHLVQEVRTNGADNVEPARPQVVYAPHGVEYTEFARALDPDVPIPEDLAAFPRPVIGFYGNICPWIDFDLVADLAAARPAWSFVLIGGIQCEVGSLAHASNIHLLGRREHAVLPLYCRGFDAAMIPYNLGDPRMETVNPVKAKELLAAGVPIVAADLPELRGFGRDVLCCRHKAEWLAGLEQQIARTDRRDISRRMQPEDWPARVAWLRRTVDAGTLGRGGDS
ncbi:MAG: hypothetical protein JW951_04865 [Lentisphaerae bacterium]|nr:hypothetical protein [Lentisphaerota bacterium]